MKGSEKTVLICDSNESVHEIMSHYLEVESINVRSVKSGEDAVSQFHEYGADLVLLDITLPDISGMEVCRRIRFVSEVPIIFLSAKNETTSRVLCLELGADDYVTKPFSAREVTLRICRQLYRTCGWPQHNTLQFEELTVAPEKLSAYVKGQRLEMTAKEISLLTYLVSNAEKVLSRDQILHNVWGYNYYGDTRAVDAAIKRIRRKLPAGDVHFEIQAVYGAGYRLAKKSQCI